MFVRNAALENSEFAAALGLGLRVASCVVSVVLAQFVPV
jgi:hypothetical protein